MNNIIQKEIANDICTAYISMIEVGLEESPEDLIHTKVINDFITTLREKGISDEINDIFTDTFLDKMYIEISKYLGE